MNDSTTEPTAIVKAFLGAFEAMDLETALTYLASDCEYTNIPMGTVRGPAGAREVLEPFAAPIEKNEFIILREAANGAVVFQERLDRHLINGTWRELPVNGVFEVHDGKITVWRDYFDLAKASQIHAGVAA